MSFENKNVLSAFVKRQTNDLPMQYKVDPMTGRIVYRCHNDFGALDWRELKNMVPKIADFGLSTRLSDKSSRKGNGGEQIGIYPIQPDHYRAPEVILGCGWGFKADIWNFGVMVNIFSIFLFFYLQQEPKSERVLLCMDTMHKADFA